MIIGSSMPVTPRVGMAVATIIMAMMVISSPRVNAWLRQHSRSSKCTVTISAKSRKKAAGVDEEKPIGVPRSSMVVYGAPTAIAMDIRVPTITPRTVIEEPGPESSRNSPRSSSKRQ